MDWGTHVVLASKILEACGLDKGASTYSNLPAIDSKPPEYHRVYAHILENQGPILDAALDIYQFEFVKKRDFEALNRFLEQKLSEFKSQVANASLKGRKELEQRIYIYKRIVEEAPSFLELTDQASTLLNDKDVTDLSTDKLSAGVSLITHIFFDTFNNPVQAFLPYSSVASGHWDLWDQIDYLSFRTEFYSEGNIENFRKEIANDAVWDVKLKPEALLKAILPIILIMSRRGELSLKPAGKGQLVNILLFIWSLRYLAKLKRILRQRIKKPIPIRKNYECRRRYVGNFQATI